MRKIQGLSILVLCFMLILTACSSGNGGNKGTNNAPKESAVTDPTAAPEESTATPEPVDMGGRVIKVAAWWDLTPAGATASEKERLAKIEEVEKNIM